MVKKKTTAPSQGVNKSIVEEIADQVMRVAMQEQARELERHLKSIHERLVALERRA